MYRDRHVTVVLPAYNERDHIAAVIQGLPSFVDRILIVDDCSTDDTQEVARSVGDPRVELQQTPQNCGVGGAMAFGYARALDGECDLVVKMDADGQMDAGDLPALLDPLAEGTCDYAKGNRFYDLGELKSMPPYRVFGNVALSLLTKFSSGYWHVFDCQNGYTAIRREALEVLDTDRLNIGYFFENEVLCQLGLHGAVVQDVPLPSRYGAETSHIRLSVILATFPRHLLRRFLARVYYQFILRDLSPIAVFLILGALLFGGGGLYGIYIWAWGWWYHLPNPTGSIMLALLPLVLGFQLLLQAIVMDIQRSGQEAPASARLAQRRARIAGHEPAPSSPATRAPDSEGASAEASPTSEPPAA